LEQVLLLGKRLLGDSTVSIRYVKSLLLYTVLHTNKIYYLLRQIKTKRPPNGDLDVFLALKL
jgi:hypothetical protein